MICYPEIVNDDNILVINDYWELSPESKYTFRYKTAEILEKYNLPGLTYVDKGTFFVAKNPAFFCDTCKIFSPVGSRNQYLKRMKLKTLKCDKCTKIHKETIKTESQRIIAEYKDKTFRARPYPDKLTFLELLCLLSILSENGFAVHFLAKSIDSIDITKVKLIDHRLINKLIKNEALLYIDQIPPEVVSANEFIYGYTDKLRGDIWNRRSPYNHNPDAVARGVYLNPPELDSAAETTDLIALLYNRLVDATISLAEILKLREIVAEIQCNKLYILIMEITREYGIQIANSGALGALLSQLAESYAPLNLFFTFNVAAKKAALLIMKEKTPNDIARHYFTKFVGDYIQKVEAHGWPLDKIWTLPTTIETSPLESLFSKLYLDGHFNWNRLSTQQIISLWLDKIKLVDHEQNSLIYEGGK